MTALEKLAGRYGVRMSYRDHEDRERHASPDALVTVLRALGAELDGPRDAEDALRRRTLNEHLRPAEPVAVRWSGRARRPRGEQPGMVVRVEGAAGPIEAELRLEEGDVRRWHGRPEDLAAARPVTVEGVARVVGHLPLPEELPTGYHTLVLRQGTKRHESLVVVAPTRAFAGRVPDAVSGPTWGRSWGVFAPLYAVRRHDAGDATRLGPGHIADLGDLAARIGGLGGGVVGTLPLLASFLDEPHDPSPYAPVSRLFWNELYIDPGAAPELDGCEAARELLGSDELARLAARLEADELVDYRAAARARRRILDALARCFFDAGGAETPGYRSYLDAHPRAEPYARFRALVERHGAGGRGWPDEDGTGGAADPDAVRSHLYAQWTAERQVESVAARAGSVGAGLYLDLPLGVHPRGFDPWWHRDLFVSGMSVGAPPDAFFEGGQVWGSPPQHPDRMRADRHTYTIDVLRHHMRHASVLRIDHVMGLHRLFWVPDGAGADEGVYVSCPSEELYAILSVESHRNETVVVGEDLGTVPEEVPVAMREHGVPGTYVVQFELGGGGPRPVAEHAVASLDTHDTPTFAGFWQGRDIEERESAGLLTGDGARRALEERAAMRRRVMDWLADRGLMDHNTDDARAALRGLLRFLAESDAGLVMVALEDLWLEEEPQNRPGRDGHNWRRRMARSLDEALEDPDILGPLKELDRIRRGR